MLKKILFKQIVVNNDQLFGLSDHGEVFELAYDKQTLKSFWLKLPSEYDDGAVNIPVTTTPKEEDNDVELGTRNKSFWDNYEEQKRKLQR